MIVAGIASGRDSVRCSGSGPEPAVVSRAWGWADGPLRRASGAGCDAADPRHRRTAREVPLPPPAGRHRRPPASHGVARRPVPRCVRGGHCHSSCGARQPKAHRPVGRRGGRRATGIAGFLRHPSRRGSADHEDRPRHDPVIGHDNEGSADLDLARASWPEDSSQLTDPSRSSGGHDALRRRPATAR